jgi:hypothetical protein
MLARTNNHELSEYVITLLTHFYELGQRFNARDLVNWCEYELHGYPSFEPLPDYRTLPCQQYGLFMTCVPDQKHMEQIMDHCLTERDRCQLRYMRLRAPLLDYLNHEDGLRIFWPSHLIEVYADEIIPGMICVQAWQATNRPLVPWLLAGTLGHLGHLLNHYGEQLSQLGNKEVKHLCAKHPDLLNLWNIHRKQFNLEHIDPRHH